MEDDASVVVASGKGGKKCQNRDSLVEEVLLGQLTHLVTFSDIFILHDSLLQGDMCIFIYISC